MVLAEAVRRGTLAVLSQDELLEFERMLEAAPEVYDYCANTITFDIHCFLKDSDIFPDVQF